MNNSQKLINSIKTSFIPITKINFYPLTRPSSIDSGINDTTISSSPEISNTHELYRTKLITLCDNNCNNTQKHHPNVTYLCQNCSLIICKSCKKRKKYPQVCNGVKKADMTTSIFGKKLQSLDTIENIPSFIYNFIKSIEQTNIYRSEGFYRKTGSYKIKSQIKQTLTTSNCNKNSTFPLQNSEMIQDPHIYAQIFKDYFRELPEPVLPRNINSKLCEISDEKDVEVKSQKLRNCLKMNLSRLEQRVFSALVMHLARVSLAKEDNLMSAENLAIIWVQCLLRFEEPTPENIDKLKIENDKIVGLLKFVIEVAGDSIRSKNERTKNYNKSSDEISKLDNSIDNREHWMRKQVTPRRVKSLRIGSTHL